MKIELPTFSPDSSENETDSTTKASDAADNDAESKVSYRSASSSTTATTTSSASLSSPGVDENEVMQILDNINRILNSTNYRTENEIAPTTTTEGSTTITAENDI